MTISSIGAGAPSLASRVRTFLDTTPSTVVAGGAALATIGGVAFAATKLLHGSSAHAWRNAAIAGAIAGVTVLLASCSDTPNGRPARPADPAPAPAPAPPAPRPAPAPQPAPAPGPGTSPGDDEPAPGPVTGPGPGTSPGDDPSGDPTNPHDYRWPTHDVNCSDISGDYADWLLAQDPTDPFRLDADHDGFPCEDKPRGTDSHLVIGFPAY